MRGANEKLISAGQTVRFVYLPKWSMTPWGWQSLLGGSRASPASVERKLIFFVQAVTAERQATALTLLFRRRDRQEWSFHRSFGDQSRVRKIVSEIHLPRATCLRPFDETAFLSPSIITVTAPLPNFKCAYTSPIGYHELAGRRTSIPRGNLTLITLRLITVRLVWFRISLVTLSPSSRVALVPWFRSNTRVKQKTRDENAGVWNNNDDDDD